MKAQDLWLMNFKVRDSCIGQGWRVGQRHSNMFGEAAFLVMITIWKTNEVSQRTRYSTNVTEDLGKHWINKMRNKFLWTQTGEEKIEVQIQCRK